MSNNNVPAILRSLIIYSIIVPLAIFVGYSLANPLDLDTLGFYGVLGILLISPIILRWHMEILVFSWSCSVAVFILPGRPGLWLVMVVMSLTISTLERIINSKMHFIRVPEITWPLLAFMAVVYATAELTGGIGLKAFGGSVYGGKKYIYLLISVLSYFAITARPIPPQKAKLYVALFFLGQLTAFVGNTYIFAPSWMGLIYLMFPPSLDDSSTFEFGVTRLAGFSTAATGVYCYMLARYGLRGIFFEGKLWRPAILFLALLVILLGGFRSTLMMVMATFIMMFLLEKLHRTPAIMVLILMGGLAVTAVIPLAHRLPFTFQRALAFLPLDLDYDAVLSAQSSTEWRLTMWTALLPQIPPHLLLGKGLAFSSSDYDEMMTGNELLQGAAEHFDASQGSLALANDFHNGMLSLIIPFGIWGVLTVLWFLFAGLRIMWRNVKYCRPDLTLPCTFLFVMYFWEMLNFVSCLGGLQIATELANFCGFLGMSIALNNGVCRPAVEQVEERTAQVPFRAMPRPRPAFQR